MAALTEEQSMIKDQAQSWVTKQSPVQKFREMRDTDVELRFMPETWKDMANMGWAELARANLPGANLHQAFLRRANLQWATLREANLQEANLVGANLQGADLRKANLQEA